MYYLSPHQALSLEVARAIIEQVLALEDKRLPLQEISAVDWPIDDCFPSYAVVHIRNGQFKIQIVPSDVTAWRADDVLGGGNWAGSWTSSGSFQVKDANGELQTGTWQLEEDVVKLLVVGE